ncbi:MAG: hypothetical protein R3194_01495 [Limnobacter sp.]|nr:hypothetical protein [Limnobacter sp.]
METTESIGTLVSPSSKVLVQRNGEQITLKQGDALYAGDLIQNQDDIAVDLELPARATGQADSLVTLAPQSATELNTIIGADGVSEQIEVSAQTEGVELYAMGEGTDGAVLLAESGAEFQGLVGAGLLAGGGVSTTAAAVGGGLGLVALGSTDDSDSSASLDGSGNVDFTDNEDSSEEDTGSDEAGDNTDGSDNTNDPMDGDGNPEDPPADEGTGLPTDALTEQIPTDELPLDQLPLGDAPALPEAPMGLPGAQESSLLDGAINGIASQAGAADLAIAPGLLNGLPSF